MVLVPRSNPFLRSLAFLGCTLIVEQVYTQEIATGNNPMDLFKFLVTGQQATVAKLKDGVGKVHMLNRWFGEKGPCYRLTDRSMATLSERLPDGAVARLAALHGVEFTSRAKFDSRISQLLGSEQLLKFGQEILTCALADSAIREEEADIFYAFKGNKRRWDITAHRVHGAEARLYAPYVGEMRISVDEEKALVFDLRVGTKKRSVDIVSSDAYPIKKANSVPNFDARYHVTVCGTPLAELFGLYVKVVPRKSDITVTRNVCEGVQCYKVLGEHKFIGEEPVKQGLFHDAFWFSPEQGFMLVKYEGWNLGWLNYSGTIEPRQYAGALWFFGRAESWEYAKGGVGRFQQIITLTDFQLNQGVSDALFTFEGMGVKPHTKVYDRRVDPPLQYELAPDAVFGAKE